MAAFKTAFEIIEDRHCPLYSLEDRFVLSDKAVEFPLGRHSCLILLRELTGLLFTLLPHAATNFEEQRDVVYTCGGCTGLIKFNLTDTLAVSVGTGGVSQIFEGEEAVIRGQLDAIVPAELLQVFHMHQKTGRLIMEMGSRSARVTFREGGILAARYEDLDNQEAIFAILTEKEGTFHFIPGLAEPLMQAREIGDFMMILMEGLKRLDEDE